VPLFDFECSKCKRITEEIHRYPREKSECPECGAESRRIFTVGGRRHGECREIWSKAMGINPNQIAEMKERFPHHEYHPVTGDLKVKGYEHQKQLAKELGMAIM
jgi:putative FmdB family regulatory protein